MSTPTPLKDAAIKDAWARREKAYAEYLSLPPESPGDDALWQIVTASEETIRTTVATTPRGAMLQLWCAMYHSAIGQADDAAITRGDFGAIERKDAELDWNVRLILAAIRSLEAMEG